MSRYLPTHPTAFADRAIPNGHLSLGPILTKLRRVWEPYMDGCQDPMCAHYGCYCTPPDPEALEREAVEIVRSYGLKPGTFNRIVESRVSANWLSRQENMWATVSESDCDSPYSREEAA